MKESHDVLLSVVELSFFPSIKLFRLKGYLLNYFLHLCLFIEYHMLLFKVVISQNQITCTWYQAYGQWKRRPLGICHFTKLAVNSHIAFIHQ